MLTPLEAITVASFFMENLPESWDSDLQWLVWGSAIHKLSGCWSQRSCGFTVFQHIGSHQSFCQKCFKSLFSPLWQRYHPWCPLQCRSWRSNSGCQVWFLPISPTHRLRLSFAAVQTRLALNKEPSSCFCFPQAGIIGLLLQFMHNRGRILLYCQ